ncbi:glycosyltransferase family 4 protein [Halosimplex marinum]|uniref:glycosyltransferase family 4 protein n=1 Tax=Halosimplex marinum TaxID=3396620 RepID=UPI003F54D1AC
MRVAYVTPYYNGACDGRFGRFHDWVHWGRDRGAPFEFDVYPFTVSNPDGTLAVTPRRRLGDAESLWGTRANKAEFLLNARRIRRALRANAYDLVHVLVMDTIVYPTTLSAVGDAPVVVGPAIAGWSPVRDVPYWEESVADRVGNWSRFLLKSVKSAVGPYDHAVAFSDHHRDIMASFGMDRDRISVLEPGVDARFSPDDREGPASPPELLYVGDFSGHKGYPHFLRALAQLDRPFEARVVGAGDPDEDRIADLGLDDAVTVEGFVPRGELNEVYRGADLVVIPTVDETAGTNVQFEALATGKPVVVTDKPGVSEFAPPDASVTFAPRTVPQLVDALERALDDLDGLTAAARRRAPEFGADRPLEQLHGIYERVLADHDG